MSTVITYPIPAYQNVPIEAQFYQPSVFVIEDITLGRTTTVTTTEDNNYVIGQLVRLIIPNKYGSRGLNEKQGYVIAIPAADEVEIDINSVGVNAFIASPTFLPFESQTQPQIAAIGDVNTGPVNPNGPSQIQTYIQGSFINISPN